MRIRYIAFPALAFVTHAQASLQDDTAPAGAAADSSWIGRASAHINHAHGFAVRHSAAFARDLRTTFRAVLPPRASTPSRPSPVSLAVSNSKGKRDDSQKVLDKGHKLYCAVPKEGAVGNGDAGNRTNTGTSSSSSLKGRPTKTATGGAGAGATTTASQSAPTAQSSWKAVHTYTGNDFFDKWDFFTGADPTNGAVTYIPADQAKSSELAYVSDDGYFFMAVETTPKVDSTRKSVRITTKDQYNGALLVMDARHMPTGCGTWPAFWSNGPNWPSGGEIDITEGVHDYTTNQFTIHTDPGCKLTSSVSSELGMAGTLIGGPDCAVASTSNQGCGIRASDNKSFGAAYNANGGGVYVMRWDAAGVAIWFFQPDKVPADLTADAPRPETWQKPEAIWAATNCDPKKYFYDHHAIFDTTLCGDWAEGVWNSAGIPGQEQSCAQRTGAPTCVDYIRNNGAAMAEAYWEVKSVKIFQTS